MILPALFFLVQTLPDRWITGGPNCMEVPDWQVHEYNPNFYILRESGCANYEKPFLYLLFGKDKALLEDTGAGKPDTARIVESVITKWLARNQRTSISLVVAHSHGHGDHIAGDRTFENFRYPVTMVPLTVEGTAQFYRIENWPEGHGQIDLGERVLDVIPIPGHERLSIALFDRQTGVLLTGDTVYPGRLYFPATELATFSASIARLVNFAGTHPITHILGTHIEQSRTASLDYPIGSFYQPDEHILQLGVDHLRALDSALKKMDGKPSRLALPDLTIWPITPEVRKEMEETRKATDERLRKTMWAQPK
ncbi:MAG TPA: MBL fold metallo-hydrolase [Bryobacteraceae bacterium]|nr:MBL fold metallo-hydrolase [Bryobacteraceae bacterium]